MTKDEALKLALEALQDLINKTSGQAIYSFMETERRIAMSACVGIKEALAQPEQEPVAWELRAGKTDRVLIEITNNSQRAHDWKASLEEVVPLYTTPPQRTWVGLTSKEVDECFKDLPVQIYKCIGAKLREKNGG
jgi:hypothetical protein